MKKNLKFRLLFSLFILLIFIVNCSSKSEVTPLVPKATPEIQPKEERQGWEVEWEKVTKKGKDEGRVVLFTTWRPEARKAISEAFKARYGIELEYIMGRGNDLAEKILTERRAGLYYADLFIGGATTMMTILRPAGILSPIEEYFILPEVKDPKAWMDGRYPFLDKKGLVFHATAHNAASEVITYNRNMVKEWEIKSWRDLLTSKFKGKIVMNDPTVAGRGQQLFAVGAEFLGLDYWRELAQHRVEFIRDQRLLTDWVAKGKYLIAIAALNEINAEYIEAGAALGLINGEDLADGFTYLSTASSNVSLVSNPPHPNATRTFLNWFLTREALTIFVRETDWHSTRLDVPTDIISAYRVRKPGFKYLNAETEEFQEKKLAYEKQAKEIFASR